MRQTYADTDLTDVYLPFLQVPGRFASIEIRTDRPSSFWLAKLRSIVAELDPYAMVPEASTLLSQDRQLARAQFLRNMLTAFASFVALLALMGVYGVTAYAVQQREREVAIRIALGANESAVVRMFLQSGGLVVAAGVALGLLGSLAATALFENQIYGVRQFDPSTIIVMGSVMTITGLLAIGWPARRAAAKNVMLVLKEG